MNNLWITYGIIVAFILFGVTQLYLIEMEIKDAQNVKAVKLPGYIKSKMT